MVCTSAFILAAMVAYSAACSGGSRQRNMVTITLVFVFQLASNRVRCAPVSIALQRRSGASGNFLPFMLKCRVCRTQARNKLRTGVFGGSPGKRRLWIIFHSELHAFGAFFTK